MPKTSIIIPAYNEEEGIVETIRDVKKECEHFDIEIIVVDDGSRDKTAELAEGYATKVVRHVRNKGKGAAMRSGFEASAGDYIIFIDADGTYPARYIPTIIDKLSQVEAVFTYRANREHIRLLNRLGNWAVTVLVKTLSGFVGQDPLSGLYGMRRYVVEAIDLESSTFTIETEIAVKISRMRFSADEITIEYRPRLGSSKLRPFHDGIRILRMLVDLLFIYQPLYAFIAPGATFLTLGFILALLTFNGPIRIGEIELGVHSFLTGIILMMIGFNIAFYGCIMDLYAVRHSFRKPSLATIILGKPSFLNYVRNISLAIFIPSMIVLIWYLLEWAGKGFGPFTATNPWIMASGGVMLGLQGVFSSIIGRFFAKECAWKESEPVMVIIAGEDQGASEVRVDERSHPIP